MTKPTTQPDSPAYALLSHVWRHQGHKQGKSWRRLNDALQSALSLAIRCQMEFHEDDFARFSKNFNSSYWISDGEMYYAAACNGGSGHFYTTHGPNPSAIKAYEKWRGRKPFLIAENASLDGIKNKIRLCVGQRFDWHEDLKKRVHVTVTSFQDHDGKDPDFIPCLIACSYKEVTENSRTERKIDRRFTITHDDIVAYHKAIREDAKAKEVKKDEEARKRSLASVEAMS